MSESKPGTTIIIARSLDIHKGDRITSSHEDRGWAFGFRFWRWHWDFSIRRQQIRTVTPVSNTTLTIK